ncbi:acetolactate synthase large subunit [Paratractidigestivibacter sp.]|uniref:acetolactate synthase large subunit n=1 Tax=Paratractidigestivibacter sp. TaxID=2847316 RepID=UPI002AC9B9B7|nr:acetolactate synthase large subunit [Paratractidigestivibacter sp.]
MCAAQKHDTTTEKTTAQVLVDCLKAEGVDVIFGIPGEENLDLMFAIKEAGIRFIPTRHEQGAAFMADVYGRLTGRAGVCLATLGPGATNLVTGVADAFLDGAPLVAITGQVSTELIQLTSHQYLDLSAMFSPITKRSKVVMRPDTVTEICRLAFKYAESGKPGATHIDLPKNIAHMPCPAKPLRRQQPPALYADPAAVTEAARMISEARNPVILAGAGAVRGHAAQAVTTMAERLHIPVVQTMMGKGIIPCDNKYRMGVVGIPQHDYIIDAFDQADLVIGIGYDLVECSPKKWHTHDDMKIINIAALPADVNQLYEPEIEVVGNLSDSIYQILRTACRDDKPEPESMLAVGCRLHKELEEQGKDNSFPMKPGRLISDIRKVLGRSDILVSDVGAHKIWIGREYPCYEPNTCLISNGFASMGFAVPGAFAAKMLRPERRVLAVSGDGGFMMNSQELETAVREKVPFVTLIWEDAHYGLIKWKEEEQFGDVFGVGFTNPDFCALAEAMHCHGYRVGSCEDFIPTLERAFENTDAPSVVVVPVDYSANMELTRTLRAAYN